MFIADFTHFRVWTVDLDGTQQQEWLLLRKVHKNLTYSLSNAPLATSLMTMAQHKSQPSSLNAPIRMPNPNLAGMNFKASSTAVGNTIWPLPFWPVVSLPKPVSTGLRRIPVTLFCLSAMRLIAYPTFLWLMFALYFTPLCHSPNSHPSKLRLSLSNISITALVLAILGSASSLSLQFNVVVLLRTESDQMT